MLSHFDKKFLFRLGILALAGSILAIWVALGWPCLVRRILHIPCLTCGMSRAWLAALRLDWKAAFAYHPMFWSIPVLAILWLFAEKISARLVKWTAVAILAGFVVCYVIRLFAQ